MKRNLALALAAALATSMAGTAAVAAPGDGDEQGSPTQVQILQFSDFHGHLQTHNVEQDGTVAGAYGGAAYLAGWLNHLSYRFDTQPDSVSYTVSSGDSIGGSTFSSGLFHDEGTIEALNAMNLVASAVGNHEFDEGVDELLRMQNGGNHPEDGQYLDVPYQGANFPYLAANVVWKDSGQPILAPYTVETYNGVDVGFIGVVTDETPFLVSPSGIEAVDFLDEATTLNTYAAELQAQGVEAIVALVHEGGYDEGAYPDPVTNADVNAGCDSLSGPILDINAATSPAVDVLLTGHTHNAYACELADPAGADRVVAGPGDWGRVVSETTFTVDPQTGDVDRGSLKVTNHAVDRQWGFSDATVSSIVDKWQAMADVLAGQVIGTAAEAITGDASGDRGIETPMADLVADSILWGTQDAGAQIAFMNVGGVRASFDQGEITYQEAYDVAPFGNLLNTLTMTGAQIESVLNQQYNPDRSRDMLALGVSEGFSYTWDPSTHTVVPGSMTLNGAPVEADQTYRVGTLSFLAEGGDAFTAFTEGTDLTGGPEDLANLVAFLKATSPVSAPADRVEGL